MSTESGVPAAEGPPLEPAAPSFLPAGHSDLRKEQSLRGSRIPQANQGRGVPEPAPAAAGREPPPEPIARHARTRFVPMVPESLRDTRLSDSTIHGLMMRFLLNRGIVAGKDIADQIKLPLRLLSGILRRWKEERFVVYKGEAPHHDFFYELTDTGREQALRYNELCSYFGAAPVSLEDYVASVDAQSIRKQNPRLAHFRRAFVDLLLREELIGQLGQAVCSGLGLFLYGAPGNGKTSIAERVTRAFGEGIWVPRAISIQGEIIRLYDVVHHAVIPWSGSPRASQDDEIDARWLYVRRPTIVVGGELTMENLEVSFSRGTGICEAPLQLKSNCGTLVIDDFGRQRISPTELLNRWILPLEKRYDILNLPSGRKVRVPFDQLIVFSTNLEPRSLVDEAFLRRVPYKIDVPDPTEAEFRDLWQQEARASGIACSDEMVSYVIEKHYRATGRSMRFCHPRDLVAQIRVYCAFREEAPEVTRAAIDAAAKNYFAVM